MEEKKQKKIKASPRPGKMAGYVWGGRKEAGEFGRVRVGVEKGVRN